jgi:hypothetical protein
VRGGLLLFGMFCDRRENCDQFVANWIVRFSSCSSFLGSAFFFLPARREQLAEVLALPALSETTAPLTKNRSMILSCTSV